MSDSTVEAEKELEQFHDAQQSSPLPAEHGEAPENAPTTEIPTETNTQVIEDAKKDAVGDGSVQGSQTSRTSEEAASNGTAPSNEPGDESHKEPEAVSKEKPEETDGMVMSKTVTPTITVVRADSPQRVSSAAEKPEEPRSATKVADEAHPEEPKSGQTERSAEEEILSRIEDVEDWAEEEKSPEEELTEEEEADEKASLDDDRDRRKPQYIPRSGVYFMHDDRAGSDEHSEEEGSPEEDKAEELVEATEAAVGEVKEEGGGRWSHDLYSENTGGTEEARRQAGFGVRGVRGVRRRGRQTYGRVGMRRAAPRRVRGGRAVPLMGRMHSQDDAAAAPTESQDEPEKENQRVLEEEKKKERSAEIPAGERRLPRQPNLLPYRPPRRGRGGPPPFQDKSAPSTPRYQNVEDWDYDEFEHRESYGRPPSRMRSRAGPRAYGAPRPRRYYEEEYEDDYYEEYERGDVGNTFHNSRVFFGRGRGPRGGRNGPPPRRAPLPPPPAHRRPPPMRAETEQNAPPVPAPPQAAYRSAPAGYPPPRTAGREPYSNRNQGRMQHSESGPSGRYGAPAEGPGRYAAPEGGGRYGAAEGAGPRAAVQPPAAPQTKRYSRRQTSVPEKQQSGDARVAYQNNYYPPAGRGGGMGGGGGYAYPAQQYGYGQPMEGGAQYYGAPYEPYAYGPPPHQPMQPVYNYPQQGFYS